MESFKKELVRSRLKWAGHMENNGRSKTGKEIRCPESGGEKGAGKAEDAVGTSGKRAKEGVGDC